MEVREQRKAMLSHDRAGFIRMVFWCDLAVKRENCNGLIRDRSKARSSPLALELLRSVMGTKQPKATTSGILLDARCLPCAHDGRARSVT